MALHLILEDAAAAVEDGWPALEGRYGGLPAYPGGFGWDSAAEDLFQDTDLLSVADPAEFKPSAAGTLPGCHSLPIPAVNGRPTGSPPANEPPTNDRRHDHRPT